MALDDRPPGDTNVPDPCAAEVEPTTPRDCAEQADQSPSRWELLKTGYETARTVAAFLAGVVGTIAFLLGLLAAETERFQGGLVYLASVIFVLLVLVALAFVGYALRVAFGWSLWATAVFVLALTVVLGLILTNVVGPSVAYARCPVPIVDEIEILDDDPTVDQEIHIERPVTTDPDGAAVTDVTWTIWQGVGKLDDNPSEAGSAFYTPDTATLHILLATLENECGRSTEIRVPLVVR